MLTVVGRQALNYPAPEHLFQAKSLGVRVKRPRKDPDSLLTQPALVVPHVRRKEVDIAHFELS